MNLGTRQTIVGIIGGKGLMGRFFARLFRRLGFSVIVSDRGTTLTNQKLAEKAGIIFFSVPIHLTQRVIREVRPHVRTEQLLLDCTSLKMIPMREMMKSEAQVIGLHPMFRPSPLGLKNQTVVMCAGRASPRTVRFVRNIFEHGGAKIITMTAQEHDRFMSIIQVLVHFHTIVLGHTFRKLKVPIARTLRTASPIYRLEMDMIGRIFSQNPELYAAIEMCNPESARVTRALLKETAALAHTVLAKDFRAFKKSFKETAAFLGSFKHTALEEINKLLTRLR